MISVDDADFLRMFYDAQNDSGHGLLVFEGEKIVFCNEAATTITGYTSNELRELPSYIDVVAEDQRTFFKNRLARWQAGTEVKASYETELATKDRSYRVVDGYSMRISLSDKPYLLTVFRDITDQEYLKQQLSTAQKLEAVARLVDGVAHDFANYLTVIIGQSQLMTMSKELSEELRMKVEVIRSASESANELVAQLLLFSRKGATESSERSSIDLNELIQETLPVIETLVGSSIPVNLSLSDEIESIWANPGQVRQVLMNLCTNAKDAISGSGEIRISTNLTEIDPMSLTSEDRSIAGSYVVLEVADTGSGMNRETRERIFDAFFTTKESGKGTGLGLSTVLSIVKRWGGLVGVDSLLGRGTTFRILLPVLRNRGRE